MLRNCLKLSEPHAGSLSSSGSEFQTIGPAIENARRPYVLSRQRGTTYQYRNNDGIVVTASTARTLYHHMSSCCTQKTLCCIVTRTHDVTTPASLYLWLQWSSTNFITVMSIIRILMDIEYIIIIIVIIMSTRDSGVVCSVRIPSFASQWQ